MKMITFEDGVVKLGDEEVPGILRSLRVSGKVRFDEQKVDGSSGKKNGIWIIKGYRFLRDRR